MKTFEWCGYNWKSSMEGGRIIHAELPWQWYSMNAISFLEDGSLELNIRKNPKEVNYKRGLYYPDYEVALMRSIEKFSFGTFSCEIMCPKGYGLWPSFWTCGDGNWPPELDIMEGWSGKDCWFKMFDKHFPFINPRWNTTNNIHYRNEMMVHDDIKSNGISMFKQPKNPSEDFIKYECEWFPDKITFKTNGNVVREITDDTCRKLYENIKNPKNGFEMNVIFNLWCEDPNEREIKQITPMVIKNFNYTPYEQN